MTPLRRVVFSRALPLLGCQLKILDLVALAARGWEANLHGDWGVVKVTRGGEATIVPLQHVETMEVASEVQKRGPGRPKKVPL